MTISMVKKILHIEDNVQNVRLIKRMLSGSGYELVEALNGRAGLNIVTAEMPDLILMDINLPDIDGIEITRRIKDNPKLVHIPIVALTANAMYGDRERFLTEGCDGYLAKPVGRVELLNTLAYFLDKRI